MKYLRPSFFFLQISSCRNDSCGPNFSTPPLSLNPRCLCMRADPERVRELPGPDAAHPVRHLPEKQGPRRAGRQGRGRRRRRGGGGHQEGGRCRGAGRCHDQQGSGRRRRRRQGRQPGVGGQGLFAVWDWEEHPKRGCLSLSVEQIGVGFCGLLRLLLLSSPSLPGGYPKHVVASILILGRCCTLQCSQAVSAKCVFLFHFPPALVLQLRLPAPDFSKKCIKLSEKFIQLRVLCCA
uniref:Uncharacterized protein n=1 Tax=Zea mays TaxID=4577 RepID=A0A804N9X4_MAIZE